MIILYFLGQAPGHFFKISANIRKVPLGRRVLIRNHQPALIPLFLLILVFSLSPLIKKVRKEGEGRLVDIMAQGVSSFWREGAD